MKRRFLRKEIEWALIIITMVEMLFIATIDDVELSSIPVCIGLVISVAFNLSVLKKYGRGLAFEKGE